MSPALACGFFTTSITGFFTSGATESLCYTEEGNTTLQINYFLKDCFKKTASYLIVNLSIYNLKIFLTLKGNVPYLLASLL